MKKIPLKKVLLFAAAAIVLFTANAYFHIGGEEISWYDLAGDEAVITVEEFFENGQEAIATHNLNKGQGLAMQTLLLRTGFLRSYTDSVQPKDGESTYRISIHFPERDVSVQVIGSRYLFCDNRWLKIADKEWDSIFQGILAAG